MVNIEIDEGSGFCFGVTTAIRKAEEELAKGNTLYCLGDIVHNGQECERLKKMGLITINHEEFAQLHDADATNVVSLKPFFKRFLMLSAFHFDMSNFMIFPPHE